MGTETEREFRRRCMMSAAAAAVLTATVAGAAHAQVNPSTTPTPAAATNPGGGGNVDELVVTAQKRDERLQDVPLSMEAIPASRLQSANVTNILNLQTLVPNFTVTRSTQAVGIRLNIRGVGAVSSNASESSVASFVDGVYVPRAGSLISSFFDLDGVEVLRGPQGTLFGRNASVGAITYRSVAPSNDFGGYLNVEYGNFGDRQVSGAVNLPVNDRLAFRVAGIASQFDGWAHTIVGNHDLGSQNNYSGRISMKAELTDNITWNVKVDHELNTGDAQNELTVVQSTLTPTIAANFTKALGGNPPMLTGEFGRTENNFVVGDLSDIQTGAVSDLSWSVGKGYTLRLIDGARDWDNHLFDGDQLFLPIDAINRQSGYQSSSQSHELQFSSAPKGLFNGHFDFVSGLYYFHENYSIFENLLLTDSYCNLVVRLAAPTLQAGCLAANQRTTNNAFGQTTTSYAAYGQGTFYLNDQWSATFGARYTDDKKDGTFIQTISTPSASIVRAPENVKLTYQKSKPSFRFNLNYKPTDDVLLFASYSTGFKSGGFNSGTGASALNQQRIFQAETVKDYELGAKTEWLNRTLTLNLTAYNMEVDQLQDRSFTGISFIVANAGNLRQRGFEFDGAYHAPHDIDLNLDAAYLDSQFLSYPFASGLPAFGGTQNLAGKPNNFSPKWQGNVGVGWKPDLGSTGFHLEARADLSFLSDMNIGGTTADDPSTVQPGYALLSSTLKLVSPDRRWNVGFFGANLTNQGYCTAEIAQSLDSLFGVRNSVTGSTVQRCQVGVPRTYGIRAGVKF
jgi:iron complex outermembrane receptor protein